MTEARERLCETYGDPLKTLMKNFVQQALEAGGRLVPLIIPNTSFSTAALLNPSVYNDNGQLLVNIRHCQYTLYHAEKNKFEHPYGPLVYLHGENDCTLTTRNYLCSVNEQLQITSASQIDTSRHDVKPIWEFIGLEDARLVRWESKLYACGVRRDTTTNGQGRMEMSEVVHNHDSVREVARVRIPAPPPDTSYCEKNWMPVIDQPFHFVKWCNPTEVVSFNTATNETRTVHLDESRHIPVPYDFRGGSQVIPIKQSRIACVHTCYLYQSEAGRKNVKYRHCFVVWDDQWNVTRHTEPFSFLGGEVEFCTGMAEFGDSYILSFAFQDNAAYLLKVPKVFIESICLN